MGENVIAPRGGVTANSGPNGEKPRPDRAQRE
jgi:hypothetical protein